MQAALDYRTNRDLFSNHYLETLLPETEEWEAVADDEVRDAMAEIEATWERERKQVEKYDEAQLETDFIRPIFDVLGHEYAVQQKVKRVRRFPDYGFFSDEATQDDAFDRLGMDDADFYRDALAVGDAKKWNRPLDKRGGDRHDFSNPSHQIHVYLQETPSDWAILTNGRQWRLYNAGTSHKLDSYYQVDLPALFERRDEAESDEEADPVEVLKYFYLFFRREGFVDGPSGQSFLDRVLHQSNLFAQELGEDLQDNIYEAIRLLAEGFLEYNEDLNPADDLDVIHDSALVYLYRLIFVFYAESQGRDLLDTRNPIYARDYSLNTLKEEVRDTLEGDGPGYTGFQTELWDWLDGLFALIDEGSRAQDIPEDQLYVPAYDGGLFRTDVGEDASREVRFLQQHEVADEYLAEVIDLLARRESQNGHGMVFVDYSSLGIRHLGSIYEGLLEYQLRVADEPLGVDDDGRYVPVEDADDADDADDATVRAGEVFLETDKGERKATGSYYTPEYVVEYIVENTLGPLVEEIREDLIARSQWGKGETNVAEEFAERVFDLKVLDPAMGSGHFLTNAVDFLAREIVDAQDKQAEEVGADSIDDSHDIHWARRQVAQKCIYGVDLNPMAVELAKVSLWLRTLAAEQPLAFLDHHLKTGNSLIGSDIEDIEELETDNGADDGESTQTKILDFQEKQRNAIEDLMEHYREFIAIENRDLEDAREMERKHREIEQDRRRNQLLAMANVHTAEAFGLDVPEDAYEGMAAVLNGNGGNWEQVSETDWFQNAQRMATERSFFHWKLRFPETFYEDDGTPMENPGFDAVIGNPPYVSVGGDLEAYLREGYDAPEYFVDLFHVFIERGIGVTRRGGQFGYIVPEPWLTMENTESLRRVVLEQGDISEILQFDRKVFGDATVDTILLLLERTRDTGEVTVSFGHNSDGELEAVTELNTVDQSAFMESPGNRIEIRQTTTEQDLLTKIAEDAVTFEEVADVSLGIQAYNRSKHTDEQIENRVFHADYEKDETYLPELSGQDVSRYHLEHDGETWVKYGDHLHDYRPMRYFSEPRILIREITDAGRYRIHAAYTDEEYCNYKTILNVLPTGTYDPEYLLAVLNSSTTSWVFPRTSNKVVSDTFPRISVSDVEKLPVPRIEFAGSDSETEDTVSELMAGYGETLATGDIDATLRQLPDEPEIRSPAVHDFLAELAGENADATRERNRMNLDVLDWLGNYKAGPRLPDVGRYVPVEGVRDSILAAATDSYPKLRIERVSIESGGDSELTISVVLRHKPEDEEEYETTGPITAMRLAGLDEREIALIESFVPVAVNDELGDFRRTAAKTISPLDRLKAIVLPDVDDVADDLDRYLDARRRAEELDRKIELTDELIDRVVYRLYDLSEEEIELVERAVED